MTDIKLPLPAENKSIGDGGVPNESEGTRPEKREGRKVKSVPINLFKDKFVYINELDENGAAQAMFCGTVNLGHIMEGSNFVLMDKSALLPGHEGDQRSFPGVKSITENPDGSYLIECHGDKRYLFDPNESKLISEEMDFEEDQLSSIPEDEIRASGYTDLRVEHVTENSEIASVMGQGSTFVGLFTYPPSVGSGLAIYMSGSNESLQTSPVTEICKLGDNQYRVTTKDITLSFSTKTA